MQTSFTLAQLADPKIRKADSILRKCVHCGFCTATCPTYVLLGDELDSPRGRIYLIKNMLESGGVATPEVVTHVDRCLSCLSCMTTCPSGVDYMHLVDQARERIELTGERPLGERAVRAMLALVLPRPWLFRAAMLGGKLARPFRRLLPGRLAAMLRLLPHHVAGPSPLERPQVLPAEGPRRLRVALLVGCAQNALDADIHHATVRLLRRLGCEVVIPEGAGCCGGIVHHMGKAAAGHRHAARTIRAFDREITRGGLDAIVINTSGCGTTVKDYAHQYRDDPALAAAAARVTERACDVSEVIDHLGLNGARAPEPLRVAYHSACSLQHGQKLGGVAPRLLRTAGFAVVTPAESHLCCGSAGTYNLLQTELAGRLRARKVENIRQLRADVVAAGNIGCITQIGSGIEIPVVHTVELLDWATGGPRPAKLGASRKAA